jgi:hypothetical protein
MGRAFCEINKNISTWKCYDMDISICVIFLQRKPCKTAAARGQKKRCTVYAMSVLRRSNRLQNPLDLAIVASRTLQS